MTSADWIRSATRLLEEAGVESPRLEAEVLLAFAFGCRRQSVLIRPEREVDIDTVLPLLERRRRREPLAYIVGRREFYSREFRVNPDVLIPRQETEILVEEALTLARQLPTPVRILDVGTGSGCIAITLALEIPGSKVVATDISEKALAVARANAETWEAVVEFQLADLWPQSSAPFDIIVSNPPYIAEDIALAPEIEDYEPSLALFAGPDGLAFYWRLAEEANMHLTTEGRILIELGDRMSNPTTDVFVESGWAIDRIAPDLGGVPRVLIASRNTVLS